jgi:hypothetical protein
MRRAAHGSDRRRVCCVCSSLSRLPAQQPCWHTFHSVVCPPTSRRSARPPPLAPALSTGGRRRQPGHRRFLRPLGASGAVLCLRTPCACVVRACDRMLAQAAPTTRARPLIHPSHQPPANTTPRNAVWRVPRAVPKAPEGAGAVPGRRVPQGELRREQAHVQDAGCQGGARCVRCARGVRARWRVAGGGCWGHVYCLSAARCARQKHAPVLGIACSTPRSRRAHCTHARGAGAALFPHLPRRPGPRGRLFLHRVKVPALP